MRTTDTLFAFLRGCFSSVALRSSFPWTGNQNVKAMLPPQLDTVCKKLIIRIKPQFPAQGEQSGFSHCSFESLVQIRNIMEQEASRSETTEEAQQLDDDVSLSLDSLIPPMAPQPSPINAYSEDTASESPAISLALHSYFSRLAVERETDCENLTVVVDNARIPLSDEYFLADERRTAAFSRSLSALNTLSFPPPFLSHQGEESSSRWDSIESQGRRRPTTDLDLSLLKPSRTRDDSDSEEHQYMDKTTHCSCPRRTVSPMPKKKTKKKTRRLRGSPGSFRQSASLKPTASLDSSSRWLRELPQVGDVSPTMLQRPKRRPRNRRRSSDTYYESILDASKELREQEAELDGDDDDTFRFHEEAAMNVFSELDMPTFRGKEDSGSPVLGKDFRRKNPACPLPPPATQETRDTSQELVRDKGDVTGSAIHRPYRSPPASLVSGFPFTTSPLSKLRHLHYELSPSSTTSSSSDGGFSSPPRRKHMSTALETDAVDRKYELIAG